MKGHTRKRGKSWAYWVDAGKDPATGKRKQVSRSGFTTERDAAKAMREHITALEGGAPAVESADTLGAYLLETWLPSRKAALKPTTYASYVDVLEGRVVPRIGGLRLREVTPKHVAGLYDDLLRDGQRDKHRRKRSTALSARTVSYTGKVLTRAFEDAVKLGLLARNPAAPVERPKPEAVEMRTWSIEDTRRFLDHVEDDRLRALWVLYLSTGMRRGEALGLRWDDVDLKAGRLAIRRTLVAAGYRMEWSTPKTAKSRRVVALDPGTVEALKVHRKRQLAERLALGEGYRDDGLVFAKVDGSPIHPQYVSDTFERHVIAAKVPMIRLHDTRHTAATVLLEAGVPVKVVSERLGHSSTAITSDVYQHVTEHMQEDAARKAGEALFGP